MTLLHKTLLYEIFVSCMCASMQEFKQQVSFPPSYVVQNVRLPNKRFFPDFYCYIYKQKLQKEVSIKSLLLQLKGKIPKSLVFRDIFHWCLLGRLKKNWDETALLNKKVPHVAWIHPILIVPQRCYVSNYVFQHYAHVKRCFPISHNQKLKSYLNILHC